MEMVKTEAESIYTCSPRRPSVGASGHRVGWHLRTYLLGKHLEKQGQHRHRGGQRQRCCGDLQKDYNSFYGDTHFITGWVPAAVWTVISTHGHADSQSSCFKIPQNMPRSFSEMIGADSRKIQEPVRSA